MTDSFKFQFLITAREELSRITSRAAEGLDKLEKKYEKLRRVSDTMGDIGKTSMVAGAAIAAVDGAAIRAFSDLESSTARLENALGTVHGMNPELGKLKAQIVDLGNKLPGSSKDFTDLAESMLSLGMPATTLTGGALKAASALQVMFNQNPAETGKQFVQMANSMGIAGKDATAFADTIQRLKYASGLDLPEIATAIPYMGAGLKQLGLQGLDTSKQIMTVMGALKKEGVEGSMIGTGFQEFFTRMAMVNPKERFATNGLRGDSFKKLESAGIHLQFFDGKGQFKGIYQAIGEMEKLKTLPQNLRLEVLQQLFGETASKMANVDLSKIKVMGERMLEQENIQKRLDRITATLAGRWDAVKGTAVNLAATMGERLAPSAGFVLDKINGLFSALQRFAAANPRLASAIMVVVTALASLALVGGGGVFAIAKAIQTWMAFQKALLLISTFSKGSFIPGLLKMGGGIKTFAMAVWSSVPAIWAQTAALLANPFTWVVVGIVALVAAVILLWKNWDKVTAWFKSTWSWFQGLWAKVPGWIKWLFPMIQIPMLIIQNWSKIRSFFEQLWAFITGFVGKFWNAGKNIVKSIVDGILSMAGRAVDAIKTVVTKIRRFLPFSPAKEGPLSDIHKIRFWETIADSMSPTSVLKKMASISGTIAGFGPKVASGAMAAGMAFGGALGGGCPIQLTIQVDARGAAPGVEQNIKKAIMDALPEIKRGLERLQSSDQRRRF